MKIRNNISSLLNRFNKNRKDAQNIFLDAKMNKFKYSDEDMKAIYKVLINIGYKTEALYIRYMLESRYCRRHSLLDVGSMKLRVIDGEKSLFSGFYRKLSYTVEYIKANDLVKFTLSEICVDNGKANGIEAVSFISKDKFMASSSRNINRTISDTYEAVKERKNKEML